MRIRMGLVLFCFVGICYSLTEVHILPHSHCDPGWKVPTDETFVLIKIIIDQTIDYLLTDSSAKYNWVEGVFLQMWWDQASTEKRSDLIRLIQRKQWRIVLGGWVMNDEACVTYSSSIDQMTHGHSFLRNIIHVTPDLSPIEGFTIDPFGPSNVQAHLFHLMGFKNHVINRIPYYIKDEFGKTGGLVFDWYPFSSSVEKDEFLRTHVMVYGYNTKKPFQYWSLSEKDNPKITDDNVKQMSEILIQQIEDRKKHYQRDQILFPFGSDVAFWRPRYIYENMNKLIKYVNEHYNDTYYLHYSNIEDYFQSLSSSSSSSGNSDKSSSGTTTFPKIIDEDFFVYTDNGDDRFESGFYVSQPRLKIAARRGERIARFCEFLYSLGYLKFVEDSGMIIEKKDMLSYHDMLSRLRDKNGQLRHHDAITGTEKWIVSDDYYYALETASKETISMSETILSYLVSSKLFEEKKKKKYVENGMFIGGVEELSYVGFGDRIGFVVFNTLSWERSVCDVKLSFDSVHEQQHLKLKVTDMKGSVEYTVDFVSGSSGLTKTLITRLTNIPAFGWKYFILEVEENKQPSITPSTLDYPKQQKEKESIVKTKNNNYNEDVVISNEVYDVHFDPISKKISRVTNKKSQIDMEVNFDFFYYPSNAVKGEQNSGAYIFQPLVDKSYQITSNCTIDEIFENDLVFEVHQKCADWIEVIYRLYKEFSNSTGFIEMEFTRLGEIPLDYEVILKIQTEIKNNLSIYHDGMGLQTKKKQFKKITKDNNIPANFWPTQYSSFISGDEKSNVQFTLITEKSQSVGSFQEGEIETMLHRRTSRDDEDGVNQALNDKYVIENFKMRFLLDTPKNSVSQRHFQSYDLNYPIEVFPFVHDLWNMKGYPDDFVSEYSFIKTPIPSQINLVSFHKVNSPDIDDEIVFRLANVYDDFESSGDVVQMDLSELFIKEFSKLERKSLSLLFDETSGYNYLEKLISLGSYDIQTYSAGFNVSSMF